MLSPLGFDAGVKLNFRTTGMALACLCLTLFQTQAADEFAWPPMTAQTKPWAFWWWMGSAVDKTNITRELERYQAAGLGGVHIIPIYGAKGFESKYIQYLSPEWMEMMGWSVSEARRLGMDVDMTTGSGWCFGGPQVTDEDANASVVVKTYDLAAGEQLKAKFNRTSTQALVAFGPDGQSQELTGKIGADGTVDFSPTAGKWTVYAISQKPSGQKVKRPAPGGEGWMLNLIYPPAMDDFLRPFTAAFDKYTGPKPRAQYHDSYEYRSDWSPGFFAEFEKRRGYRLQTELPALFGDGTDDHAARVRCDYRQTVAEIMAEESLPAWTKWAHEHGFITRDQAHGSPGNWLDLYATADIPETEMFHTDRNKLISKFASSAAHVTGKPLVSSETGTWLAEHFTETLGDVKYLFDDMFLSGINHMFYHGCCYSPDEAGWPGWHFYASTEMNPRNSIWHDADAVNAYAARCQSVLQSGAPDNDVLLYWPITDFWMQPADKLLPHLTVNAKGWFAGQPIAFAATNLWNLGYGFDYVSDAQLQAAKVVNGKVSLPGGKYQTIVVPACQYIPLATFKQLLGLAKDGATVIFEKQLPSDISGGSDLEKKRAEFKALVADASTGGIASSGGTVKRFGGGRLLTGNVGLQLLFAQVHAEAMARQGLSFVRRSFDGGWNYFIANRGAANFDDWITLARPGDSAIMLDPMTGKTGLAARNAQGQVHVQLGAGESLILRTLTKKIGDGPVFAAGPVWGYWQPAGAPIEINGQWEVKFVQGGPTLPAEYQTAKLASWTTFPDTNAQAFAGSAEYVTSFDAPSVAGGRLLLTLGDVRQSARVKLNGKDYGTLITAPFSVVVDNLQRTGNLLEVEVTSVSANRIRDLDRRGVVWKTFRDINIVDLNYKPFDASDWSLTDCGLLGPVTLTPLKAE